MFKLTHTWSSAKKFATAGILFGCVFPLIATPIAANFSYRSASFQNLLLIQQVDPLMWIIDTAPLFLGLFAYYAGYNQDLLKEQVANQEQIIIDQTATLREALNDAHIAIEAKGQFMANMSHELRTPLNAIIGYSEIVEEVIEESELDEGDELLQDINRIKDAGQHLLRLVSTVLEFSKIEANKEIVQNELFEPDQAIQTVIDLFLPTIRSKNVKFKFDLANTVPNTVIGDRVKFQQILFNVLSNAFKFTDQGNIEFSVSTRRDSEDQRAGDEQNKIWLLCSVVDSGIGISSEDLGHVVEPFHQADNSMTRRYEGTGLGLSISKQLCELLGGRFSIWSQGVGLGTTVTFEVCFLAPEGMRG